MRPKKEPRESFGSTLKKDLMDDLRQLSIDTDVPISKLLDQAVTLLLQQRGLPRDNNRPIEFIKDGEFVKVNTPKPKVEYNPYEVDFDTNNK